MQRSNATEVTSALRNQFRSAIEGCIPDLIYLEDAPEGGLYRNPDESDRDSIYDYAADRACDLFPNLSEPERFKLVRGTVDHFCGPHNGGADPKRKTT